MPSPARSSRSPLTMENVHCSTVRRHAELGRPLMLLGNEQRRRLRSRTCNLGARSPARSSSSQRRHWLTCRDDRRERERRDFLYCAERSSAMPAEQRGSVYPTSRGYGIRWRDERSSSPSVRVCTSSQRCSPVVRGRRAEADARRDRLAPSPLTLAELVDEYLAPARRRGEHDPQALATGSSSPSTGSSSSLRVEGAGARSRPVRVDRLDARTVGAWRHVSPRVRVARPQGAAAGARLRGPGEARSENVAQLVPNPEPKRREVRRSTPLEDLDWLVAASCHAARHRCRSSSPVPACGRRSGSRSSGATSTRQAGVLHVRRVYIDGRVHERTARQPRSLRGSSRCASECSRRSTSSRRGSTRRFCSPASRGGHLNLHAWRRDEWKPALTRGGARAPQARTRCATRSREFAIAAGVVAVRARPLAWARASPQIDKHLRAPAARRDRARRGARWTRSTRAQTRRLGSIGQRRPSSARLATRKPRVSRAFLSSGRRDSNSGPLVPQTSALTRLRHAPRRCAR